jgi:hypothetical protein
MMQDRWRIGKPQKSCISCGRKFFHGEEHYSGIEKKGDDFVRMDYCKNCWKTHQRDFFSFWKRIALHQPKEDLEAAVAFFEKLFKIENLEEKVEKLRYLLGLVLLRRKRLKVVGKIAEEGQNFLEVEKLWNGMHLKLKEVSINQDELSALALELERLFEISYSE